MGTVVRTAVSHHYNNIKKKKTLKIKFDISIITITTIKRVRWAEHVASMIRIKNDYKNLVAKYTWKIILK
jgi:biotin carboxylase